MIEKRLIATLGALSGLTVATASAAVLGTWAPAQKIDEIAGNSTELNTPSLDCCPTPLRGNRLLFVSRRVTEQSCGMGDIYVARDNPKHGWSEPRHLACAPDG